MSEDERRVANDGEKEDATDHESAVVSRGEHPYEPLIQAIEGALQMMHKKRPPEEIADLIRTQYEHPRFFIEASQHYLMKLGMTRLDAYYFTLIPRLTRYMKIESFGKKPRLNRLSLMVEYLKALFFGVYVECYYLLVLDRTGKLAARKKISEGTLDAALFDLHKTVTTAVDVDAKIVVLAHNHPRGTMRPSDEDINCTYTALRAMMSMQTLMLDHIIVGKGRAMSIRDSGYIPAAVWEMQKNKCKMMREWIDVDLLVDD